MAEPTYTGSAGRGRKVFLMDARSNPGQDVVTDYGYQNYLALRDPEGSEIHLIIGSTAPSTDATYDSAPLGSLYFNTAGGNDTSLYIKEATGGAGWAPVTTGAQA